MDGFSPEKVGMQGVKLK